LEKGFKEEEEENKVTCNALDMERPRPLPPCSRLLLWYCKRMLLRPFSILVPARPATERKGSQSGWRGVESRPG
jgi:hypothetical protein